MANKPGIILIVLSIIAVLLAILSESRNQFLIFNLAFPAFAAGLFLAFANGN